MNKKRSFPVDEQQVAMYAKALSHPARLLMLRELANRSTCVCGDMVELLPLSQSTVSQHLNELKLAGLIKGSIDGTKSCYCIDVVAFRKMKESLNSLLEELEKINHQNLCC